jgi:hypothetical protein
VSDAAEKLFRYSFFISRIYNPLAGISKDDLHDRVLRFCQEHGFEEHADTFQKGALAAQHQKGFEDLSELTDDDKHHLRREHTRTSTGILESFHLISNPEQTNGTCRKIYTSASPFVPSDLQFSEFSTLN